MRKGAVALSGALGLILLAAAPPPTSVGRGQRAHSSHAQSINAEARLHYLHTSGSTLVEEGPVTGSLHGHAHADLTASATFNGSFTFYTSQGEIKGHGTAQPHGSGRYESFSGHDVITGGTGRYAHAHAHGTMYGTYDRVTYNVTIQTRGTLYY